MNERDAVGMAVGLMKDFGRTTGLSPVDPHPGRYLWTDAFAVCNYLGLFQETGDNRCRETALRLVGQVHHVLGKFRSDDPRAGWISGLDEEEGELHPTQGGLRIGKKLPERLPGDRYDDRLEWDRDGQYYHYLTKWMHALNCVARVTGDQLYLTWAIELARTAHARFAAVPGGRKAMYWKMSTDLSRPLVPSMGLHDPLDGFVTYSELRAAASVDFFQIKNADLRAEIADMAGICRGTGSWVTADPLGIGGLLFDAGRIARLMAKAGYPYEKLLARVLDSAGAGLTSFIRSGILALPAEHRLAFRELGLSIGLHAAGAIRLLLEDNTDLSGNANRLRRSVRSVENHVALAGTIEEFWLSDENRKARSWREHRDINSVMLATSLAPEGFILV